MNINNLPDNPYLLLTPGPLSTSKTVKATMLQDWCTWDDDYKNLVEEVRSRLIRLATQRPEQYTTVLMQGSGTFSVEAMIGTAVPRNGKLLVLTNGAYGNRIIQIARYYKIDTVALDSGELDPPDLEKLEKTLAGDPEITHVAVVHCETTTGMLNPIEAVGRTVKKFGKTYLVDTMSSFGGVPMDVADLEIDFCVSSANKCIQGVPGFCFVIAKRAELLKCEGNARSLSLDLFDQWKAMEVDKGKWRYTSPTHVVRAFYQAMQELEEEGGISKRHARYIENHRILVDGMRALGFKTLLPDAYQSPIITSFYSPEGKKYDFRSFYNRLKQKGFVIYPGKVSKMSAFRIGNIGHVFPDDMRRLIEAVEKSMFWND
ncbi:MAG: 2-aminoethylphosphonate--pyruvate transaminase [Deltaproteobacteria bacterium]|nr:2-aminoethylphosphonate--pyruvate transaminase [Deltaproteobacteria bacterium]MBW1992871.1 2-aminoethylphosphonate--pyruvate transaminase [Deltaproteobacteria bacterium]MBW2154484.1 2-aminoethylphosphonate--pyruvate transaminase [Deltaproteobacteria bacterium]